MVPATLLQYLAQSFSASVTSASRPALTFFVVQSSVLIGVHMEWLIVSPGIEWMLQPLVVGALGWGQGTIRRRPALPEAD